MRKSRGFSRIGSRAVRACWSLFLCCFATVRKTYSKLELFAFVRQKLRNSRLKVTKIDVTPSNLALFRWLCQICSADITVMRDSGEVLVFTPNDTTTVVRRQIRLKEKRGTYKLIQHFSTPAKKFLCPRCGELVCSRIISRERHRVLCSNYSAGQLALPSYARCTKFLFRNSPYRRRMTVVDTLQSLGIQVCIEDFSCDRNFCCFDIESTTVPIGHKKTMPLAWTENLIFMSSQEAVLIGVAYRICDDPKAKTKIFWRKTNFISKFVSFLIKISVANCEALRAGRYSTYFSQLNDLCEKNADNPILFKQICGARHSLSQYVARFCVIGYNSSRYDILLLRRVGLFDQLRKRSSTRQISILKKDNAYIRFALFFSPAGT